MTPKTIVWRIEFNTAKEPGILNTCVYFQIGEGQGLPSGIAIDEFPEYYDTHVGNTQLGDLLPYKGSIFVEDDVSGKLRTTMNAASLDSLAERTTYSVFRSRETAQPSTTTTYDIVASDTNVLISRLKRWHLTEYEFNTFVQFKDLMKSDRTLKHLYGMIRAVEITPVDTLVAAATNDNRRKIVKWYIDKI